LADGDWRIIDSSPVGLYWCSTNHGSI